MTPFLQDFWTITLGCICGSACALVGCFLLLRRMSLMGDALSHGILPGIAVAVLLTGQFAGLPIFVGAMVFGVLTAALAQALHAYGKVGEDAALGVVFTSLFALGVIMISRMETHLDLCIFLGQLDLVSIYTLEDIDIPRALPNMALALGITLGFITLLWKELKLATFDPGLATAMGYSASLIHYLTIALVAAVTVASFEAFGSILVLAFLIVPAATAHLFTDRMRTMLATAVFSVMTAVTIGYFLTTRLMVKANMGGMMAVVLGGQFALAVLFAPRHGILVKILRRRQLSLRIASEEILASLFRQEEGAPDAWQENLREHGLPSGIERKARRQLRRQGWIEKQAKARWVLTPAGRYVASSVVRSHRLWETFLGQNFELPLDHLHAPASIVEHYIGPELQQELAKQLEKPAVDPHGRQIPTERQSKDSQ